MEHFARLYFMVILIVMWYNIIKIIFIGDVMYEGTIKGFPLIKSQNEGIINKNISGSFYMI